MIGLRSIQDVPYASRRHAVGENRVDEQSAARGPTRAAKQRATETPAAKPFDDPVLADGVPLVVLVHGMARTPASMWPIARRLEGAGFETFSFGYSSVGPSVAQIGARLADVVRERSHPGPVHFVTHSLGGVVVRAALGRSEMPGVGRVVMLAPPNRGSQLADCVAPYLGWLLKPLPDLTTHEASAARALPIPRGVEIGIIAGDRDGKVRLENTHLEGETAHVVVRGGHSLFIYRRAVQEQVIRFLREGRFAGEFAP